MHRDRHGEHFHRSVFYMRIESHVNRSLFLRAASNASYRNARDARLRRIAVWFRVRKKSWMYFFRDWVADLLFFGVAVVHTWRRHARDAIFLHRQDWLDRDDFVDAVALEALLFFLFLFGLYFCVFEFSLFYLLLLLLLLFGFDEMKRLVTFQPVTFPAQLVARLLHKPLPLANMNFICVTRCRGQRVLERTNFFPKQNRGFHASSVVKFLDRVRPVRAVPLHFRSRMVRRRPSFQDITQRAFHILGNFANQISER